MYFTERGFPCRHISRIVLNALLALLTEAAPEVFCKKGVLGNFAKFTGEHLCHILFFNRVAGLRPSTLLKKRLWHRCFTVNFAISKNTFSYRAHPVAASVLTFELTLRTYFSQFRFWHQYILLSKPFFFSIPVRSWEVLFAVFIPKNVRAIFLLFFNIKCQIWLKKYDKSGLNCENFFILA